MPGRPHQLSLLAALISVVVMLSGCGIGHSNPGSAVDAMRGSPMDEGATMALAGVPEDQGLAPLDAFTVPPGSSVQRGNVEVTCPAGGPACVVSVTDDGIVEYEIAGGIPAVDSFIPGTREIAAALASLVNDAESYAIARFSAPFPPPGAITCKALTIGCEGGLGPIHYRSVGKFDVSGFEFIGRRRGVSLAERRQVSRAGDETSEYRALAGWLDHSFFLIDPPGLESELEAGQLYRRYHGTYSMGNPATSNPDVLTGSTATWSGIMSGFRVSDPDAFVNGDATITVSGTHGTPGLLVDVAFTNIRDERGDADLNDVSWSAMELENGSFGVVPASEGEWFASRHPAKTGISGRFYGPNHEELGGLFSLTTSAGERRSGGDRLDVSGVFGARRDD